MGLLQKIERAWIDVSARTGALRAFEARTRRTSRSMILCYHGIRPERGLTFDPNGAMHVTPQLFETHLAYLTRACDVLPLDAIADRRATPGPNGRVAVAITFDDGYRDNLDVAFPLLRKYGCPATIFLPTSFIGTGRPFWWEQLEAWIRDTATPLAHDGDVYDLATVSGKDRLFDRLRVGLTRAGPARRQQLLDHARALLAPSRDVESSTLSWPQIDSLAASGLISFGAHTVNHFAVSSLTDAELDFEVGTSRHELAQRLAVPSGFFAYPYGRYADLDPRAGGVLRAHGFTGAVTLVAGAVESSPSAYSLPRIFVERGDDVARLRAKIAGVDAPFWLGRRILDRSSQRRMADGDPPVRR